MNERHLIDTNVFNIRFPSPQQAQAEQDNGLTDFIKDRLLHIVDQVFIRLCPPQTAIRIDTLELDLGTLPCNGWRDEMAQRLESELTKALREKIASLPTGGSGPERLLTPPQRRLDTLRCFLEHGCLPAALSADHDNELERCLRTALNDDSSAFLDLLARLRNPALAVRRLKQQFSAELIGRISRLAASHLKLARLFAEEGLAAVGSEEDRFRNLLLLAFYENRLEPLRQQWQALFQQQPKLLRRELFRHGRHATVRRRMAWDFPEHVFADIIRLLEPTETEFIEEIVFRPALPKEAVAQPGEAEDHGRKRLREFTLAYLLTERGSRFNKKEYLASLISRMAAHDNLNAAELTQSLQETLAALSSKSKVQQEMLALLTEISADSRQLPKKQRQAGRSSEVLQADEAQLEELLRQAFHERLPERLRQQWTVFFKHQPELIRRSLFLHGQSSSDVRRRIAWDFPEHIFADFIRLLEPTENEFIEEIVFRPALPKEAVVQAGDDEESGRKRLCEFTLAYLLTERGSRFNKKEYLASLISSMAAHDNLDAAKLMQSLQSMLTDVSSKSRAQQEMLLMLTEMQEDKPALRSQQPAVPMTIAQLLAVLKERSVSEELMQAVRRHAGQVSDQERYCQLIAACLREDRPVDFEELLAQCGGKAAKTLPKHDHPEAFKLPVSLSVEQLIALLAERQVSKELLQAVRRHADQVRDKERYCQLIAACLREDRPIDFEELLAQCGEKAAKPLPEQNQAKASTLPVSLSLEQLLTLLKERNASEELMQAMRRYAAQVGNQERYCQLIAACLREDRPIDFEELLAQCKPQAEQAAPKKLPAVESLAQLLTLLRKMALSKELIEAVERYAQQADNLERYCELIIACLNEDRPVDLEEIVVQSQKGLPTDKQRSASSAATEMSLPISLTQFRLSAAEEELAALLVRQEPLTAAEYAQLARLTEKLLAAAPARLRWFFEAVLPEEGEKLADRIAQAVGESLLHRIFRLLCPAECAARQAEIELTALACCAAPLGLSSETVQRLKHLFISQWLFAPGLRHREQDFALAFAEFLHQQLRVRPRLRFFALLRTALVQQPDGRKQAKQRAEKSLRTELARLKQESASSRLPPTDKKLISEPQDEFEEEVMVENAGMIIAATYLPRLFSMLGLLEKSAFKDAEAAERAVHLLQYLVEQRTDRPEYQLVLNKILCGVQTGQPIIREIEASAEEKETIDGLLAAIIKNWGALGSTSVAGLREAFLQRSGRLRLKDDAWYLEVEQKAYDMLLDRLPWSFSLIKLPWMQRLVHVKWR